MLEFPLPSNLSSKKVKTKFTEDIEPQEVLLDALASRKEKEIGIEKMKLEKPLPKRVLAGFLILFLALLSLVLFRTFQLQIVEGKNYRSLAEKNQFTFYKISAERGIIYDRNYRQLVWNKSSFDLIVDRRELPSDNLQKEAILKEVAAILQKDSNELKTMIDKDESAEVLILRNVPLETLIVLESKQDEIKGFKIRNSSIRDYKLGPVFSHLLGYMGLITKEEFSSEPDFYTLFDWVGKAGIEKAYEKVLRKNPGKIKEERDALGNLISAQVVSKPESGKSVVLWLDSRLQEKARDELSKKIEEVGAKSGVVIAMDPNTGGVLALVSLPDFDNNLFQQNPEKINELLDDKYQPLFNRAISGKYLTGSTIKPLIAAAALEEKIIDPEKKIYSKGYIEIPHRYNPEITYTFRDWTVHGWVDMRKAIAQSSNVYFYTIGGGYGDQRGLGPTKIKEYLEKFGWTSKTGVDLPFEAEGFVPDKEWKQKTLGEGWWDGDTYYLSIGQQYIQITPLEVVTAFSAIANGGTIFKPMVVKEIVDSNKNILEKFEPQVIRSNFISKENLEVVKEGMRHAVSGENAPLSSATILNSLPVAAAAKTGTAELGNDYFNNWVTVFAPYDNPQIVITVMIEKVKGLRGVVLPVARDILQWYFSQEFREENE